MWLKIYRQFYSEANPKKLLLGINKIRISYRILQINEKFNIDNEKLIDDSKSIYQIIEW